MLNPWSKLPTVPTYILKFDKSVIFNNKVTFNENTELHFELLPEPFLGNPLAPVVLLNLNPGYSPDDITYHGQPAFIKLSRANLNHQISDYSFYLLNPSVSAPGRVWWEKKLGGLIRDTSSQSLFFGCMILLKFVNLSKAKSLDYSAPLAVGMLCNQNDTPS